MKRLATIAVMLFCLVALISTVGGNRVASAAGLDQLTTSTLETLAPLQQIFNGPITVLSTTGTSMPCELWVLNFTATTGQYLSGTFNSDIPVSFYVVQLASYQNWVKADTCGSMTDSIAGELLITSYVISPVAIPSSGTWTIVIVNSSNARNADGYLAAYLTSMPYTVTQPITGTVTMTFTSTTSTVFTSQPVPGQSIPGFPAASIILGITAGLAMIIMLRRRKHA